MPGPSIDAHTVSKIGKKDTHFCLDLAVPRRFDRDISLLNLLFSLPGSVFPAFRFFQGNNFFPVSSVFSIFRPSINLSQ